MATRPNTAIDTTAYYANLADVDVVAGVETTRLQAGVAQPARRVVIGSIGAAGVTLTRPDGVEVTVSQAQCTKLGGIIARQCIAIKSANSTDISVEF